MSWACLLGVEFPTANANMLEDFVIIALFTTKSIIMIAVAKRNIARRSDLSSKLSILIVLVLSSCLNPADSEYTIEKLVNQTNKLMRDEPLDEGVKSMRVILGEEGCFTYEYIIDESAIVLDSDRIESYWVFVEVMLEQSLIQTQSWLNTELARTEDFKWLAKNGYCVRWEWRREDYELITGASFISDGQKWTKLQ